MYFSLKRIFLNFYQFMHSKKQRVHIYLFRKVLKSKLYLMYILISALVPETELTLKTIY